METRLVRDPNRDPEEEKRQELISKLKANVRAEQKAKPEDIAKYEVKALDEYAYIRFLRARKWDINLATKMLVEMLKWRTSFKPHKITEFEVASEYKKEKVVLGGFDKVGRLVVYIRTRLHYSSSSDADLTRKLAIMLIEKGIKMAKPDVPYTTLIFDLTSFGLSNMDYKLIKFIIDVFANYYPETLGLALVVNSPWLFTPCWAIIKPWIDPVTAQKVVFVKTAELNKHCEKESLLEDLGGTVKVDLSNYVPPDPAAENAAAAAIETPKQKKKKATEEDKTEESGSKSPKVKNTEDNLTDSKSESESKPPKSKKKSDAAEKTDE